MKQQSATSEQIISILEHFKKLVECVKTSNIGIRPPNFLEISEYIVCHILNTIGHNAYVCSKDGGDIICDALPCEVKSFVNGPISFGPTESWTTLYILDCSKFSIDEYTCYKIKLSNTSEIWQNIRVNKNQTYRDQCNQKRRPRLTFDVIIKQVPDSYVSVVFSGNINAILQA